MNDRKLWSTMPPDVARFYQKIFNNVTLNIYAVRMKMFPYLLCEHTDPKVNRAWEEAKPLILQMIARQQGLNPDPLEDMTG